jgi:predicted GIY-YIG superfamily endonuclease
MKQKPKPNGYWTFERCLQSALQCTTKKEFRTTFPSVCRIATKNKWLKDMQKHLISIHKPNGYWTFKRCKEEALKYNTRMEFCKNSSGAYSRAVENGWLKKVCKHMPLFAIRERFWTYERCKEEALKYNTRKEFHTKSGTAYNNALEKQWLDSICKHMVLTGNLHKRGIYIFTFSTNIAYIGLTYNFELRKKIHLEHESNREISPVRKYMDISKLSPTFKILYNYTTIKNAVKLEKFFITKYKKEGWTLLNKSKGGDLGSCPKKWTFINCQQEANKYTTRSEFKNCNSSAYSIALRNGWINDICKHMILLHKPKNWWTKHRCHQEALGYTTKSEFATKSCSAYSIANKKNWLKDICQHMPKRAPM